MTWAENAEDGDSPLSRSGLLMDAVDRRLLIDPWGRPLAVELSGVADLDPESGDVIATIRSDGMDGRRGTDDDVALVILSDGRIHDEATHLGQEE